MTTELKYSLALSLCMDPSEAVQDFIDRDQSGGGYQRNWEKTNAIYSCPKLGGYPGHLAVGDSILEYEDDEDDIFALILP